MKITHSEIVCAKEPIRLAEPWKPAWRGSDRAAVTSFQLRFYRVYTDEGIVGIGPFTGGHRRLVKGIDPVEIETFWNEHMSAGPGVHTRKGPAGLEIALWDILGKAAGLPVYKLIGATTGKIFVYAAISRLLDKRHQVQQIRNLIDTGFKAVKLRLHRSDPWDDVAAVEAVREAVGNDILILADANQGKPNAAAWSRSTAFQVAKRLEQLGVYLLEDPLVDTDLEGLAQISDKLQMFIAGGERVVTPNGFDTILNKDAYDILQPDIILRGHMGITGLRKVAGRAESFGKAIIPHVHSGRHFSLSLAATLHAMATVKNCPMVEFPYDPPILTTATNQAFVKDPLWIDSDGFIKLPDKPGIGIEITLP